MNWISLKCKIRTPYFGPHKRVQIRSFFWSVFSRIWTERGDLLRKCQYSVQIRKNKDQKKLRIWTSFVQWCLCAIDAKDFVIQVPGRSDSTYFNYEKFFSIVYRAIGNAKYEFSLVNTGIARRLIDGGILNNNVLGIAIENNVLNSPELERILRFNKNYTFPYAFSVDEVLFLQPYMMMRPCPWRGEKLSSKSSEKSSKSTSESTSVPLKCIWRTILSS